MSLIQVVFGVVREIDFQCRRCTGSGIEPGSPGGFNCLFCGGLKSIEPGPCYTYDAPDPAPALWSVVTEPGGKACTVVAHGSTYTGPVKAIL
jgi:hypothetical protein